MASLAKNFDNQYCLVVVDDSIGEARIFEFEAPSAQSVIIMAGRHCRGRKAEVFENGRSLCSITNDPTDGFWLIAPTAARTETPAPVSGVSNSLHAV